MKGNTLLNKLQGQDKFIDNRTLIHIQKTLRGNFISDYLNKMSPIEVKLGKYYTHMEKYYMEKYYMEKYYTICER